MLDPSVVTDIAAATAFLYAGPIPIQYGVATGTIASQRVAVLRGLVTQRDGTPLPAVQIAVLGHPELGLTLSRTDGMFDLAVNGGGLLTVTYAKAGFLSAQRQIQAPWRDYRRLPDVVLLPIDPEVSAVDLMAATIQVARGSPVTDADGTRQATLFFLPGTQATMTLPDGTMQPLTTLHVRATETSVGPSGPTAVAAEEPPAAAYTYAADFRVDEAVAAGATTVQFSQPVMLYLEDFLGFPVGMPVPVGGYVPGQGLWVPSDNGRVVQVLGVTGGVASLDVDGSGNPASADALAALGIAAPELAQVGTLYTAGTKLWRAPIPHFSDFDT